MDPSEDCWLPDDLPYEGWIDYVFDHRVSEHAWWWGNCWHWNELADPSRTLTYLTRLFRDPQDLIARFSRAQIDLGLQFLSSTSCSNHMTVLTDTQLPWSDRAACLEAMIPLYEKLFAPVFQDDAVCRLRDLDDPERPNFACFMWWDVIPLYPGMKHEDSDRIDDAVLRVFEHLLKLKAESCLESVLHGLGHWQPYIPDRIEPIAHRFLSRTDISPALRQYAERAAVGAVQ